MLILGIKCGISFSIVRPYQVRLKRLRIVAITNIGLRQHLRQVWDFFASCNNADPVMDDASSVVDNASPVINDANDLARFAASIPGAKGMGSVAPAISATPTIPQTLPPATAGIMLRPILKADWC